MNVRFYSWEIEEKKGSLTRCSDLDNHIVRMLDLGQGYLLDGDLEWAFVVQSFHGSLCRHCVPV